MCGQRLGVVGAAHHARHAIARRQNEIQSRGHEADQRFDAPAPSLLIGGQGTHQRPILRGYRLAARMLIRDVMTESVVTADADTPVRQIAELMRERNVGSVVLLRDQRLAGFITDRDLTVGVLADGRDGTDHAQDHASAPVVTASSDMDVSEAAELMIGHGIRRLPVIDGDRLTGIVTLDDLAVRTADPELVHTLTSQITRAALPDFYFHQRGE